MKPIAQAPDANTIQQATATQNANAAQQGNSAAIPNPLRGQGPGFEQGGASSAKPAVVARWKQSTTAKMAQEMKRRDSERGQIAQAQFDDAPRASSSARNQPTGRVVTAAQTQLIQERERSGGMLNDPPANPGVIPPSPRNSKGRIQMEEEQAPELPKLEPPSMDSEDTQGLPSLPEENNVPSMDLDGNADPQPADPQDEQDEAPAPPRSTKPRENPFGGGRIPQGDSEDGEADLEPAPRKDNFVIDCDKLRERALGDDIRKIDLNISPAYGVGVGGENPEVQREKFAKTAPIRSWRNYKGEFIADAKLVNLKNNFVILETKDGSTQKIRMDRLSDPDMVYLAEAWQIPVTCSLGYQPDPGRNFTPLTAEWTASGLCHNPLYFEDVQLERYGHEIGPVVQPFASTAHFFGNIAVLPYKMGIHPMNECQYALGYYRPGNCAPWTVGPVPISLKGALFQAGAVTGMVGAVP